MEEKKKDEPAAESLDDESSLENLETPDDGVIDATGDTPEERKPVADIPKQGGIKEKLRHFNFYLIIFGFILVIAAVIITIAYMQSKQQEVNNTLQSQGLNPGTLQQLQNSDATVGDPKQVLNVQSNAVFAGKVLVRSDLDVAGNIQLGGTLNINSLTAAQRGTFGELQSSGNLSVGGDSAVQGQSNIGKNIQVGGAGSFGGPITAPQITTSNFQLNGDLKLTRHIAAGGPQPSQTRGNAVGGGGTAGVSGSDTAGSVSINTGSGAPAGCFITVNFALRFNATPRVIVSPVGSDSATIPYYVNRSTTGFSICTATPPASGLTLAFDYFIVE